ncbi:MAG: imidazole glycerol-phosphate synthase subunit HisH [Solirubrobacteraceae bacterium]|nr:imidazole glycerol-phosphate synthase subunit HisH [Solirubrobacteraceae bacterium]
MNPTPAAAARPPRIAIVDYGMGNRRSVEKALAHVGAAPVLTGDHDELRRADGLILPGVGAFPEAMLRLAEAGLDELIRERAGAEVPILGLCLGMQLAFERSAEHDGSPGLGIVPGEVRELRAGELKIPHIGWSPVRWRPATPPACPSRARSARHGALLAGLPDGSAFYHVHSYVAVPSDRADWLGTAEYGERFVTAVARGSFWGVQFHPEKSSTRGLRLLANFAAVCLAGSGEAVAPGSGDAGAGGPGQAGLAGAGPAGGAGWGGTDIAGAGEPVAAGLTEHRGGMPAP